jgi:hypothetical protein
MEVDVLVTVFIFGQSKEDGIAAPRPQPTHIGGGINSRTIGGYLRTLDQNPGYFV